MGPATGKTVPGKVANPLNASIPEPQEIRGFQSIPNGKTMLKGSMAVGDDFKVSRRYREDITDLAARWRAAKSEWANSNRFDVVRLLLDHVLPDLAKDGRKIELRIVENDPEEPDAWVDFYAGEMCVQRFVWDNALAQEEHARLVVAHEVGHLILHRDQVFAFSRGLEKKLGFLAPEESAEQQANWFAAALLLPDAVVRRLSAKDTFVVATLALVSEHLVRVRRREVDMDKRYRSYTGDQCECGSLEVIRVGVSTKCEACGAELESS